MLIPPGPAPQDSSHQSPRPGLPSSQAMPRVNPSPTPSMSAAGSKQMLKTPSQPIPSVQAQTPAYNAPQARPAQVGAQNNGKPFMPAASVSANTQIPRNAAPAPTRSERDMPRKLFISLAIVIVALLIVMLLLLVTLRGHNLSELNNWAQYALLKTQSIRG